MKEKNPITFIILGVVLFLIGTYVPNGVEFFNEALLIGVFNFAIAICQGLGAGLVIGGVVLLIKGKK